MRCDDVMCDVMPCHVRSSCHVTSCRVKCRSYAMQCDFMRSVQCDLVRCDMTMCVGVILNTGEGKRVKDTQQHVTLKILTCHSLQTSTFMSKKDRSPANSSTSSPKSTSLNTASLGGNGQSSNSVSKRSSSNIHQK
eukprot:925367-Amorphochlora_amoeboformis.AAC.1